LGHLAPGFREFRRSDDGVDPSIIKYARGADQASLLKKAVGDLRYEGYDLTEIVEPGFRRGRLPDLDLDPRRNLRRRYQPQSHRLAH
jgi:hypothetical protein